ncbi:dihydrofolate reductase [Paenibacillus spiritus]|uniref:Dihydrofolate reductase n=1 Tax=Paenibacillus spiritus TaxID=2496557 RepID=A0A5J5GEV3_9BACL|nr:MULTISPECIES: dihydrofolate reductase [Paenibacillus]KAA9006530.1 dihydrofolate reductase [Paenibacillus spiritus]
METTLIWAMDRNGLIGRENGMPWSIPRDFAFFKERTMGKTMLMGRKTWESLGSRPLPGRRSIILTRDPDYRAEGAQVAASTEEALKLAKGSDELMVIGGAEIYRLTLPYADRLVVTRIDHEFEGDTYFPEVDWSEWKEVSSEQGIRDEKNPYDYRFMVYERSE